MSDPTAMARLRETIQLSHLPNELLIHIFQELPRNELVSLAAVSHCLHVLALEVLFKRHSIDTTSKEISLGLKKNTIGGLPGLGIALSVVNTSLRCLHCDLTTKFDSPNSMVCEARELTRFVSKLAEVQQVSLRLMHPLIPEWEDAVLELFDTILLKSCTSLSVTNLESSTYAGSEPSSRREPLTWPASTVLAGFRYFFEKPKPTPRLTTCSIQALPRFLRPFYERALNESSITSLSFKHIFNALEWAAFSAKLHLPNLEHLSITHSALLAQPLEIFLIRHSSIKSLDFRHNSLMPLHPPRLPKGILPRLAKLQTSPDYLTRYFPATATFPAMASIVTTIGNKTHRFSRMDDLLSCIGTCRSDITLSLTIGHSAGLEIWLRGEESQVRIESNLHCVKALELDNWPSQGGFGDSTLALIAQWLALFPAVEHISIHRRCFLDPTESSGLFFQRLKEALVPRNFDYNTTQAGLQISENRSV